MKITKKILKWILSFLLIPILYLVISLLLSSITINRIAENQVSDKTIYLSTNGIHLDIVIPKSSVDSLLLEGLKYKPSDMYLSFGWGDEDFYLNTPTWGDLTFKTAFKASFLKSSSLMHVTRYNSIRFDWVEVKVSDSQIEKLNDYLLNSFKLDKIYLAKRIVQI